MRYNKIFLYSSSYDRKGAINLTDQDIYLSLPKEDHITIMKFLNKSNLHNEIRDNGEFIEILVKVDENNSENGIKVAREITNLVIDVIKDNLLKDYIYKQYKDTYPNEENNIYLLSLELIKQKEYIIRKSIDSKIYNYILNNNHINIDGFVKFRMKEFIKYISVVADLALEEYLINKDQEEFINVLKYFVDIQEEKIDLIKIHIISNNLFILYDKHGNKIENIDDEDLINLAIKENLNYEDFLISTLLTLCPKKIEILDEVENNISKEMIDMIKSIFINRVSMILKN